MQFIFVCDIISFGLQKGVRNAAIAQQVERILGKDEVTSSNLVSSSGCHQFDSYKICISRCGSVWLERHVRDVEAAGSSPVTSIKKRFRTSKPFFILILSDYLFTDILHFEGILFGYLLVRVTSPVIKLGKFLPFQCGRTFSRRPV